MGPFLWTAKKEGTRARDRKGYKGTTGAIGARCGLMHGIEAGVRLIHWLARRHFPLWNHSVEASMCVTTNHACGKEPALPAIMRLLANQ